MRLAPPALVLILLAPQAPAAETMGRLFYTPDQRAALDSARSKRARTGGEKVDDAPPPPPAPEVVTYSGMVRRSDGKTTVWLNNRAVTEKGSADAKMVGRVRPDGTVILQSAQTGRNVPLRVGQRAELLSGRVEEGYRRVAPKAEDKPDSAGSKPAPDTTAATEAERRERERQDNLDDAVRAMRDAAQARTAGAAPQPPGAAPAPGPMQPPAPGTAQVPAQPYQ